MACDDERRAPLPSIRVVVAEAMLGLGRRASARMERRRAALAATKGVRWRLLLVVVAEVVMLAQAWRMQATSAPVLPLPSFVLVGRLADYSDCCGRPCCRVPPAISIVKKAELRPIHRNQSATSRSTGSPSALVSPRGTCGSPVWFRGLDWVRFGWWEWEQAGFGHTTHTQTT